MMDFEPIFWCEDCSHFEFDDLCGEGICGVDGSETYYGWSANECADFCLKEACDAADRG